MDKTLKTSSKKLDKINIIDNKIIEIIIYSPSYGEQISLIDKEDYDKIKNFKCSLKKASLKYETKFYATVTINKKRTFIHRLILNSNKQIDHINGNSLDNRKENLREATQQKNCFNRQKVILKNGKSLTSKYKGVSWIKDSRKWLSSIIINSQTIRLGRFKIEEDAAQAYNEAAIKYFGEFANLNDLHISQ